MPYVACGICCMMLPATCHMPHTPHMPHWAKVFSVSLCVAAAVASVYEASPHRLIASSPRRLVSLAGRCQATSLCPHCRCTPPPPPPHSPLSPLAGDVCLCGRKMWKTQCEQRRIMSKFRFIATKPATGPVGCWSHPVTQLASPPPTPPKRHNLSKCKYKRKK